LGQLWARLTVLSRPTPPPPPRRRLVHRLVSFATSYCVCAERSTLIFPITDLTSLKISLYFCLHFNAHMQNQLNPDFVTRFPAMFSRMVHIGLVYEFSIATASITQCSQAQYDCDTNSYETCVSNRIFHYGYSYHLSANGRHSGEPKVKRRSILSPGWTDGHPRRRSLRRRMSAYRRGLASPAAGTF